MEDEWTYIGKHGKKVHRPQQRDRRKANVERETKGTVAFLYDMEATAARRRETRTARLQGEEDTVKQIVARVHEDMGSASMFLHEQLIKIWERAIEVPTPEEMMALGVGNFGTLHNARFQVALALLLCQALGNIPLELYDPLLTSAEKKAAQTLGMIVLECNEEGKRCVERPTLFFMPHCGKSLYSNVLRANWTNLQRVIVLGNCFDTYVDRLTNLQLKQDPSCVVTLAPYASFVRAPEPKERIGSFNDMALHWFRQEDLTRARVDGVLSETPPAEEPVSDTPDIIPADWTCNERVSI